MKIEVEINNVSKDLIKNSFLIGIFKETLGRREFDYLKNKKIAVSVALVDSKEISRLNKIYRKKNSATDVLSFAEYKNEKELRKTLDKNIFRGEIILCYNFIVKNARGKKEDVRKELAEIASHGLLHLLGFKHGEKMFKIQKEIAK
jgi:probable rRNA maturation factor